MHFHVVHKAIWFHISKIPFLHVSDVLRKYLSSQGTCSAVSFSAWETDGSFIFIFSMAFSIWFTAPAQRQPFRLHPVQTWPINATFRLNYSQTESNMYTHFHKKATLGTIKTGYPVKVYNLVIAIQSLMMHWEIMQCLFQNNYSILFF